MTQVVGQFSLARRAVPLHRVSSAQESRQSLPCATSSTNPRQQNSGVSSHLPQNRGSFASGAKYERKEQDILLLSCNSTDYQHGTIFSLTFGLISIGKF